MKKLGILIILVTLMCGFEAWGEESSVKSEGVEGGDSGAIVASMQAYYDKAQSFSAEFRQVYESVDGIESKSSGVVWFKKPGMMRWDYAKPDVRFLISDGNRFWSWEPKYRQYCEQSLASSQLPTALSFLTGEGKLADDFHVSVKSVQGSKVVLNLVPKVSSSAYSLLEFEVVMPTARVRSVKLKDSMGNINRLEFISPEINGAMDAKLFKFNAPKDAKEICKQ